MPQDQQSLAERVRARYPGAYDSLSDSDLEQAVIDKYPQYESLRTPAEEPSLLSRVGERMGELRDFTGDALTGAAKGVASTATGAADMGLRYLSAMGGGGGRSPINLDPVRERLAPEGQGQRVGFGLEQVGEFVLPVGGGAKAASMASRPGAVRGLLRMAGEGAEMGGKAAVQSGGDLGTTATAAGMGGAGVPVAGAVSGVRQAVGRRLPLTMFRRAFRRPMAQEKADIGARLSTEARNQPINPELAEELLDRGVRGTARGVGIKAIRQQDEIEGQLLDRIAGQRVRIGDPERTAVAELLEEMQGRFGSPLLSPTSRRAGELATALRSAPSGDIPAEVALRAKRFLDSTRAMPSFKMDANLSVRQENLKTAADMMRSAVYTVRGAEDLLDEERIMIEAIDRITSRIAESGNRPLVSVFDVALSGGGFAAGAGPAGVAVVGAVRGIDRPAFLTNAGVLLNRTNNLVPRGGAATGARGITGSMVQRVRPMASHGDDEDDE